MENNIEVNNLTKKYDGFELKNINFTVPKGSIVGFVGENGAENDNDKINTEYNKCKWRYKNIRQGYKTI